RKAKNPNHRRGAACLLMCGETRLPAQGKEEEETAADGLVEEILDPTEKEINPDLGRGSWYPTPVVRSSGLVLG
ncbi:hypothetical protein JTB14_032552, partial [Gonioctena quinquepunctata]